MKESLLKWFVLPRYCKYLRVYIFTVKLSESLVALTVYLLEEIRKSLLSKYQYIKRVSEHYRENTRTESLGALP